MNVVYSNTEDKPIEVSVATGTTQATTLYLEVNSGTGWVYIPGSSYPATSGMVSVIGIVPAGAEYYAFLSAGSSNGFLEWTELR